MVFADVKEISVTAPDGKSINKISFTAEEKGVYGFFGNDEAELSLLADAVSGMGEVDCGEIFLKGEKLYSTEKKTAKIKKKTGHVPKKCYFPDNMTLREVMDFTGRAKKINPDKRARQIKEALELTGLTQKTNSFIKMLTPSEKKRAAYANALLGNPDVIFIEEPFSSVDSTQINEVKKLIAMLGKMKAVILFAKKSSGLEELCAYEGIVDGGCLIAYGRPDELKSQFNEAEEKSTEGLSDSADAEEV